ncbi:MAG: hypothetical protein K5890_11640 [Bacteroidales bacterium]|nr:hypothetical protein [Bacteroidales bacterium]
MSHHSAARQGGGIAVLLALMIALLLAGCGKQEKFPVVPAIKFVSLEKIDDGTGIDNKATLTLHFQDGDGDLGLNTDDIYSPFDTASVYYYNLFIDYYKKIDGQFRKIEFEAVTFNQRFPRLSNDVPESIEGDLYVDLPVNSLDPSTQYDTIKFSCYIVDRALHVSNTVETTPLVVKKR